jgi:hypothetical protein
MFYGKSYVISGEHFSVKLTPVDLIARAGAAVTVQVTINNVSEHEITYRDTAPDCDYSVRVWSRPETMAPETTEKKNLVCNGMRITGRNI